MEVSGEEKLFQHCVYKLIIRPNENNNMDRLESLYFRGKTIKLYLRTSPCGTRLQKISVYFKMKRLWY